MQKQHITVHEKYMKQALRQAQKAYEQQEVPVGAVIVFQDKIIARAFNKRHNTANATAHAEILAIEKACKKIGDWRLEQCDMYVTLEPCAMCAGAAINSRLRHVYFGAYDPKAGCCATLYSLPTDSRFNHVCMVTGGILQQQCAQILTQFFKQKRTANKQ